jgi:hypothetical protein
MLRDPHSWKDFKGNASTILANLATGNDRQIQPVVDSSDVVPALLDRFAYGDYPDVRKEAAKTIRNDECNGTALQVMTWSRRGLARSLCAALVVLVLKALENIFLRLGDDLANSDNENDFPGAVPLVMRAMKTGGLSKIHALGRFDDDGVHKRSIHSLGMYSWYEGKLAAGGRYAGKPGNGDRATRRGLGWGFNQAHEWSIHMPM